LFGTAVLLPHVSTHAQTGPQSKTQSTNKTATLLVDTDDACHLFIDDADKGTITPDASSKFTVTVGEHLLKCKNDSIPDLMWRKAIEVKGTAQVVAVVSLKALHVQYDQVVTKAKNQKEEVDSAAAKQLAEAKAEEQQREADKVEFPKRIFETVKGTWGMTVQRPPFCDLGPCTDRPYWYSLTFKELVAGKGIRFSMEWLDQDIVNKGRSLVFPEQGNRYEGYFTPIPPNRLQGVPFDCDKRAVVGQKKKIDAYDYIPCSSVNEGFAPGVVNILSQDQLEFLYSGKRLVLTREAN